MTIKEIEKLSGIPRANIRYYEQEGLIDPKRLPNGYRAYTDDELATLEKIKLLRGVGVSLEDIRALQSGEDELSSVLSRRLRELEGEAKALEEAKNLCRAMRGAGESYATLNAAKYANALPEDEPVIVIGPGMPQYPPCQWRRYFARAADLLLYRLVLVTILTFTLRGAAKSNLLLAVLTVVVMLLVEPLLLRIFGTTLGKFLFGLRVTNNDGGRLSYGEGWQRTKYVLIYGMGFTIPIVEWIMNWKSYKRADEGLKLYWEDYSNVVPSPMGVKNAVAIPTAIVLWIVAIVLTVHCSQLPPNRGDLTVAQFAENYNAMIERYDLNLRHMTEEGQLYVSEVDGSDGSIGEISEQGAVVISFDKKPRYEFEYTLENGVITQIIARGEVRDADFAASCINEQLMIALAFGGARKEMGIVNSNRSFIERKLDNEPFRDCSFKVGGVSIDRDIDYSGYYDVGAMLVAKDNVEALYREVFTISLVK